MGDGMPCPPSPLLFDPSLTLEDHSVRDIAGGPVGILTVESQLGSLRVTRLGGGFPVG